PEGATVLRSRRDTSGGRAAPQSAGDESRGTSLVRLRARAARGPERAHRVDESVPCLPCSRVGGTFRVAPHLLATLSVCRFSAALDADDYGARTSGPPRSDSESSPGCAAPVVTVAH